MKRPDVAQSELAVGVRAYSFHVSDGDTSGIMEVCFYKMKPQMDADKNLIRSGLIPWR